MKRPSSELLPEALAAAKAARAILQKAADEKRELTKEESTEYQARFDEASAKHAEGTLAKAAELQAAQLEAIAGTGWSLHGSGSNSYKGSLWATQVTERIKAVVNAGGIKSLSSGAISVPSFLGVEELPAIPTRLLDMIPRVPLSTHAFTYLRETARTMQADTVADGQVKPQSTLSFEEADGQAHVVAHLSEPFPVRYLDDYGELVPILDREMRGGVLQALEAKITSGDGGVNDSDFTGIWNTTGVLTVEATDDDLFVNTRRALTRLELLSESPTGWALNPADVETIDLATDLNMRYQGRGPFEAGPGTLWSLPRTSCLGVPQGYGVLADWRLAKVLVREDTQSLMATQATITVAGQPVNLWEKNLVCIRCEGQYGFTIRRPRAFLVVDLGTGS